MLENFLYKMDVIGTSSIPTGYVSPSNAASRIQAAFNIILIFVVIMATFFIIKSGLDYVTSGGDAGKVKAAQGAMTYAVLGLIVAGVAFAVIKIVSGILGIGGLDLNL